MTNINQFVTALATVASSFIAKKWTMDNMVYTSVNTIIIIATTYLLSNFTETASKVFSKFTGILSTAKIFGIILAIITIFYYCRKYLYLVYEKVYLHKYQNSEIIGTRMVSKFIEYIRNNKSFYHLNGKCIVMKDGEFRIRWIP